MTNEELLKEMETAFETQGEKGLEAYVIEHFAELPKAVQGKALMSFAQDALDTEAGEAAIGEIQEQGMQALEILQHFKNEVSQAGATQA